MSLNNNAGITNTLTGSLHIVRGVVVYSNRLPNEKDPEGWLKVKLEPKGYAFLHENTKLIVLGEKNNRVYFKVDSDELEIMGETVSLTKANAILCTHTTAPIKKPAIITVKYTGKPIKTESRFKGWLTQQFADMVVNGTTVRVTLNSIWPPDGSYSPIIPGKHRIMAPDHSHNEVGPTRWYREAFPSGVIICNDIWFPIELAGTRGNSSRYIHLGNLSEGCVTVYDVEKWNIVYNYLISHRIPNTKGLYVGELVVEK